MSRRAAEAGLLPAPAAAAPPGERWTRLAASIAGLGGWRRSGLAFALGVVAVAALPPVYLVPVVVVAFTGLVWLLDGARTWRAAFWIGWWFGFGYFVAGIYWIAHALLIDPERFGWLVPFGVGGLSAYFALYPAAAAVVARWTASPGVGRVVALAAAWTVAEWLRGIVLSGFAWNPVGSIWAAVDVVQLAALTGVYGLTLLTVLAAAAPAALAHRRRAGWWLAGSAAVLVAAAWLGGAVRLAAASDATVDGIRLRLVQPNVSQVQKWREDLRVAQLAKLFTLSRHADGPPPTHIIWPETATPYFVANEPRLRQTMAQLVPPGGALITGAMRLSADPANPGRSRIWNSLHAIDGTGAVTATYDKFHLVPFGEYVPLRSLLGLAKLTHGDTDFSAGAGPATIRLAGLPPFSPLICYEVIFPGEVVAAGDRPGWLLNVTNDAWFGVSSGPYQHFASAQLRAIEEGLPVARAANTGVSGIIDAYGRVVGRLELGREGVLDGPLPRALAQPPPFARFGNTPVLILCITLIILGPLSRNRRARVAGPLQP
jgi:apolipoprotein N-acyltransferase